MLSEYSEIRKTYFLIYNEKDDYFPNGHLIRNYKFFT